MSLSATQNGGTSPTSWKITYLYDEQGRPYAGVYRQPDTSTTPLVFGIVTTDRGDVVSLLDGAGAPFAAYRYDAWGKPTGTGNVGTGVWSKSTGLISLQVATDLAKRQPLRYAAYYYDAESGLYYLSSRSYDPATRQFLSKDLSRNDGEESAYQYCGGNPIGFVDPTGFIADDIFFYKKPPKSPERIFREVERASANTTKASVLSSVTKAQVTIAAGSAVIVGGVAYLVIGPERLSALAGGMGATAAGVSYSAKMAAPTVTRIVNQVKHLPHVFRDLLYGTEVVAKGGAAPLRVGQAGEAAVRAATDIGEKIHIQVNGAVRIPDGLTSTVLSEVKNVGYLSYTQQLRDFSQYAGQRGLRFDLYVRTGTTLSGTLQEAVGSGDINLLYIPPVP